MPEDGPPHQRIPAWKAFAKSSNVGIAKLTNEAYRHDRDKFYSKLKQFRLTEKTGVTIKGEPKPFIKDPAVDEWSRLSVPWMSTGYEVQITPLQMLTFYNAIANGGVMVKPQLVEKVMDHGRVMETFGPEVLSRQISTDKAIGQITEMMISVVEEGTATKLKSEHYKIAGKTGTARIHDSELGYIDKYQASFAGFYPADNPKYSCIVVVLGPSNGMTHGGQVAGPVFKEIADKIMSVDLEMHEIFNDADEQTPLMAISGCTASVTDYRTLAREFGLIHEDYADADYINISTRENGELELTSVKMEDSKVPDVKGMSLDDALYQLENAGLKVSFKGSGKVVRQSIKPGTDILKNSIIQLQLG